LRMNCFATLCRESAFWAKQVKPVRNKLMAMRSFIMN